MSAVISTPTALSASPSTAWSGLTFPVNAQSSGCELEAHATQYWLSVAVAVPRPGMERRRWVVPPYTDPTLDFACQWTQDVLTVALALLQRRCVALASVRMVRRTPSCPWQVTMEIEYWA